MNLIRTPLCHILRFGFRKICEVPAVFHRMSRAAGEGIVLPPLDGAMLLAEAKIEYRARGMAGLPLLLLAVVLMVVLMLVLLPVQSVVNAAAGFLERHQDQVRDQQDGTNRPVTPGALLLLVLLVVSIAAALP